MLSIDLVREIPEAMKPRKIEIGGGENAGQQIEGEATEQKVENDNVREREVA